MDDSGPAYPSSFHMEGYDRVTADGLTKREAFTMAAMQGLLSNPDTFLASRTAADERSMSVAAYLGKAAVEQADATLAALREGGTP